jgi:hypothetical protein
MPWPRSNAGVAAATLAVCLVLILVLQHSRGIWLDEAARYWLSSHDVGLTQLATTRWVGDVHPPLFSAYAWALQPLLGGSVKTMRLVNLGGLLWAALTWRQAARRGLDRDFLALFAVLVASCPFCILYAAEFLSAFLQLALGACLIVQLRMIDESRGGWALAGITALLLVNLDYFGGLVVLALVGAEAVRLVRTGRKCEAGALLLILAATLVPLALALAATLASIVPAATNEIRPLREAMYVGGIALVALVPNVAALVALARASPPRRREQAFALVLFGALGALVVAYFLLSLATGNLLPRHMIAAVPISAALAALLLEHHVKLRRRRFALICINALVLAAIACGHGLAHKRWERNVHLIEIARQACSPSPVYALDGTGPLSSGDMLHGVPEIAPVIALTYQLIAREHGFAVTVLPSARPIAQPGRCPALLWIEHLYARPKTSDEELARAAGFEGPIKVTRLQRGHARALLAIEAVQ